MKKSSPRLKISGLLKRKKPAYPGELIEKFNELKKSL